MNDKIRSLFYCRHWIGSRHHWLVRPLANDAVATPILLFLFFVFFTSSFFFFNTILESCLCVFFSLVSSILSLICVSFFTGLYPVYLVFLPSFSSSVKCDQAYLNCRFLWIDSVYLVLPSFADATLTWSNALDWWPLTGFLPSLGPNCFKLSIISGFHFELWTTASIGFRHQISSRWTAAFLDLTWFT